MKTTFCLTSLFAMSEPLLVAAFVHPSAMYPLIARAS